MIALYYHLYLAAGWQPVAAEYLAAVQESGLPGDLTVGLAGTVPDRSRARSWWREHAAGRRVTFVQADRAWEHLTLNRLRHDLRAMPDDGAVCYAHAKGVYHPSTHNTVWRQSMTRLVIRGWRECTRELNRVQAVGCHWLTLSGMGEQTPIFGGNFWWARADYLRTLPAPAPADDRHAAERWIGLNRPEVTDLNPVWPCATAFSRQEIAAAEKFEMAWANA